MEHHDRMISFAGLDRQVQVGYLDGPILARPLKRSSMTSPLRATAQAAARLKN